MSPKKVAKAQGASARGAKAGASAPAKAPAPRPTLDKMFTDTVLSEGKAIMDHAASTGEYKTGWAAMEALMRKTGMMWD